MRMYSLIVYSDNYLKTSGSSWHYYRDESSLNNAGAVADFTPVNHNSKPFKYKQKITVLANANGKKNVEIMVPLKYLSNFFRNIEKPLINCEIMLILTWSKMCYSILYCYRSRNNICND